MNVRPLPTAHGVGMTSDEPLDELSAKGFHYEHVGRYHNYYATKDGWKWPLNYSHDQVYKIDGFSPNLNKELHVGHLRNLAVANSLERILSQGELAKVEFVALFGATLGVKKKALTGLQYWLKFVEYHPVRYYDVLQPTDVIETRLPTEEEMDYGTIDPGDHGWPFLWDGPDGPVIVTRGGGSPLYAYYDLVFAQEVGPTHYITGIEQKEHFKSLGLDKKHLGLGLVLNSDGKKMKSREGDSVSAIEAIERVEQCLNPTPEPRQLAWNVLAWNFLQCKRDQNVKFDVEAWTSLDAPGMYITYTYARTLSAMAKTRYASESLDSCEDWLSNSSGLAGGSEQLEVDLASFAGQYNYWHHIAVRKLDPAPLAHFAHDLARKMGYAYHKADIVDGRQSFVVTMQYANETLRLAMQSLGMFSLARV